MATVIDPQIEAEEEEDIASEVVVSKKEATEMKNKGS